MKVTEKEAEVVEKNVTIYICDRCGDEMETNPDHGVQVNPRIELKEAKKTTGMLGSTKNRTETVKSGEGYSNGPGFNDPGQVKAIVEDEMEWCQSCVDEVFHQSPIKKATDKTGSVTEEIVVIGLAAIFLMALIILLV